jgi:cytochrome b561
MTAMERSAEKWLMYDEHKQFGILVGILVIFRLVWKLTSISPAYPKGHAKWQELLAAGTHFFLYLVMIMFPVSGYMMSMAGGHGIAFFGFEVIDVMGESKVLSGIAHDIHWWLEIVTYVLVGAHASAALYHHIVVKNNVLKGMLTSDRIR